MRLSPIFKHICIGFAGILWTSKLTAQQLPVMNQYIYNPYLYNPARTGQKEQGSININFKRQWVAIPNSPITGALSMETPIAGTKLGVGGLIYSDRTHLTNRVGGLATCAYHIPFNADNTHRLSGGLSLGVINQRILFAEATIADPNDAQLVGGNASGTAVDFSTGLDYQWKDLHVGVSLLQGLNNKLKYLTNNRDNSVSSINSRHWIMSASYHFRFGANKDIGLTPTLLGRYIKAIPFQAEVNLLADYKKFIYAGFGYRSSNVKTITSAISSTIGVSIKEKVLFAYSFEFSPNSQLNNSLGTQHEFMVSFKFGKNKEMEAQAKRLDDLAKKMEEMRTREQAIDAKLQETNTKLEELNQAQNQQKTDLDKEKAANEEARRQLQQQAEELKKHDAKLKKHDEELEDIRKKIGQRSPEFKKMGEVEFTAGSAAISPTTKSQLDAITPTLKNQANTQIYVYGHASTDGNKAQNLQLSNTRAINVRKYLIAQGIPAERIEILPFGSNNTKDGSDKSAAKDRRAEIFVTEKP